MPGSRFPSSRSLRALEWAPHIRQPDREAFEARTTGIVTGPPRGKQIRAPVRSDYYPVEYVSSSNRSAPLAGYDVLSSDATGAAVLRAITTGEPASTEWLPLWDEHGDGVIAFLAVYDAPDKGYGAAWRLQHSRGVLLGVVDTSALLAAALRNFAQQGMRAYVFDLSATGPGRLLYPIISSKFLRSAPTVRSPDDLRRETLLYSQKLAVGGQDWEVDCVGTDVSSPGMRWQPLAFLLCGLAVTAVVTLYLGRVSKYTEGLAIANVSLRTQMENRQKAQAELDYQAHHDPLTGLPNRREFGRRFNEAIERAKLTNETLALFFVDLDGSKMINDTLGHLAGDGMIKAVGERFRKSLGRNDVVARTGGDEFNILLTGAGTGTLADRVAQGCWTRSMSPLKSPAASSASRPTSGSVFSPNIDRNFRNSPIVPTQPCILPKNAGRTVSIATLKNCPLPPAVVWNSP